jgi:hypothetical protein
MSMDGMQPTTKRNKKRKTKKKSVAENTSRLTMVSQRGTTAKTENCRICVKISYQFSGNPLINYYHHTIISIFRV